MYEGFDDLLAGAWWVIINSLDLFEFLLFQGLWINSLFSTGNSFLHLLFYFQELKKEGLTMVSSRELY